MATVKESVKQALVGSTEDPTLSQQAKQHFMQFAAQDAETGDYYLGENEFIDAIAPAGEDYVSQRWA